MFLSLSSTISTVLMRASSLAYRQREGESGSLARRALEVDLAPVQLDELPGQREPEPRALGLARVVAPDLAELLEHEPLVLGGDADAGVAHRDLDLRRVELRRDVHPPAV